MSGLTSPKYIVIPWLPLKKWVTLGYQEKERTKDIWQNIAILRSQINKNWQGVGAVEEIREQRGK